MIDFLFAGLIGDVSGASPSLRHALSMYIVA